MKSRFLSLMVGAALLTTTGFSGAVRAQDADLIAAAKKEGEVTWYTGLIVTLVVRPLAENFEKKYGIKVKYTSTSDSETVLRLTQETRANKVETDLFDTPGTTIPQGKKIGFIEPYKPASAKDYPAGMNDKDGLYTSIFALYLTTNYNTDLVKAADAPKTYEDLLDPKWKGKMVWVDTRTISGPPGFIAMILQTMGEQKGMDYLKKLSAQNIVALPGNQRVVLDQVIAGQYALG